MKMKKIKKYLIQFINYVSVYSRLLIVVFYKYLLKSSKAIRSFLKKNHKKVVNLLVVLFGLVGSFLTIYTFMKPDISLTFTEPINSQDVFTSYFTINNNGFTNAFDIGLSYKLNKSKTSSEIIEEIIINESMVSFGKKMKVLKAHKRQTIFINFHRTAINIQSNDGKQFKPIKLQTFNVDLTIFLTYKYWYFFSKTDAFNFTTSEVVDNKIIWLEYQE